MPPIELDNRFQKAVCWVRSTTDDRGNPVVAAPVELDVRWQGVKAQSLNPKSAVVKYDATVVVDREIPDQTIFWKGDMADLPEDLTTLTDLYESVRYTETPDIRGKEVYREVGLIRYRNALPTVES